MSASLPRIRLPIVWRFTAKFPFLSFPQICVKPRKSNVAGFFSPFLFRSCSANRPNSISRVLSGFSSRPNFLSRPRRSSRKRSRRQLLFISQIDLVGADVLRPQLFRRPIEVACKQRDLLHIFRTCWRGKHQFRAMCCHYRKRGAPLHILYLQL